MCVCVGSSVSVLSVSDSVEYGGRLLVLVRDAPPELACKQRDRQRDRQTCKCVCVSLTCGGETGNQGGGTSYVCVCAEGLPKTIIIIITPSASVPSGGEVAATVITYIIA